VDTEEQTAAADLAAATYDPPPDSFCDVVMKGGITSGVVYPQALCTLARKYRFRNVGGTSAGAIAAAATAAAEYGRGAGAFDGFRELAEMPAELGAPGRLPGLFQPQPRTRRLFGFSIACIGKRPRSIVAALLRGFWLGGTVGALPGILLLAAGATALLAPGSAAVVIAALVVLVVAIAVTLAGAVLGMALSIGRDLNTRVVENGFGLCSGMGDGEALIPWLHDKLQRYARLDPDGPPLTFRHLWNGPGRALEDPLPATSERFLSLEMMTTNLTNRRPHALPWEGGGWYYKPAELRKLFPAAIVKWIEDHPRPLPPVAGEDSSERRRSLLRRALAREHGLLPLPAEHLPVLVATRLSLSFPVLLSAVPLWQYDMSAEEGKTAMNEWRKWGAAVELEVLEKPIAEWPGNRPRSRPQPDRCWFSDGGISSNFPVHFFDRLVPRWPTFAINLRPFPKGRLKSDTDQRANTEMAESNSDQIADWWYRFPTPSPGWLGFRDGRLRAFLGSAVKTMQNRVDEAQMRVPGYRDRIAHVNMDRGEGGLNLTMGEPEIAELTARGRAAAERLLDAYWPPDATEHPINWSNHRWVRFRSALSVLQQMAADFADGATAPSIVDGPDSLLETTASYRLAAWQKELAKSETARLSELAAEAEAKTPERVRQSGSIGVSLDAPRPAPVGKIAPKE
jgi:hypothetical protein